MMRVVGLSIALLVLIPSLQKLKPVEPPIPELVNSINAYRARHGLPPMIYSPELQKAAERHASDMAAHNRMSHSGSDGSNFSMRARAAGFPMMGGGEIVAGGSASEAVSMWSQSPGHNAQMLSNRKYIGAAGVGEFSCAVFGDK